MLTFGGHLEIFRKMLLRIVAVIVVFASVVFCCKQETFTILLAPSKWDFTTFRIIEHMMSEIGVHIRFEEFSVPLISTDLSSQFMTHITVSCILGVLLASPYIIFELFRFISPALYDSERRYSVAVAVIIYAFFIIGLLMSYYVIFPISFRFLANYQVDEAIKSTITLDSYISTFTTLMFMMGIVFQLPVLAFILGRMGFIDAALLKRYRSYAFVLIMVVAAIITPPDIFTLLIVCIPIYALYELSIFVLKRWAPEPVEYGEQMENDEDANADGDKSLG
ncbi:MAG: twin-arginine translocase subunit TatC [Muribaculaceae bacterium]|nr:twin-arginine translocase subunit TatC [Muribaculaceae bacterium]